MNWQQLISNKRFGLEHLHELRKDDRTEFQRDYDRLVFSAPFRRLQNKTQVFPLPGSIFVHNRLTHSLEVSCVGRSLGNEVSQRLLKKHPELANTHLSEIGAIVSAACLAHDLGNPPFGHSGEKAIGTYFSEGKGQILKDMLTPEEWNDIIHFEGNANAFRLLTHQFKGRRQGGFVMTYSTLASIVKYPYSSVLAGKKQKFGFFITEEEYFKKIADELGIIRLSKDGEPVRYARYPLVYLVEAADDICYQMMDIEDAHKLKILTTEETKQLYRGFLSKERLERTDMICSMVTDTNEQIAYLRSTAIGILVKECTRVFVENEESILTSKPSTEKKTHSEYVKTYSVYAEQGAVVTWSDPKTGQFRYKDKCETCGQVASGEHSGGLFVGEGSSYNAGFTCTNSNCSMWGKSQRAIISCSTSGEWIEVDD